MSRPRVAVIGGSIAGLFAALALRRRGFRVSVYERATELADRGAGLTTHAALHDAVAQTGVALRQGPGVHCRERVLFDPSGKLAARRAEPQWMTSWGHIYRSLRAGLPEADYHNAKRLEAISIAGEEVEARFSDGETAKFDWLVGADGMRSRVRAVAFPGTDETYAGYFIWRGLIDESLIPADVRAELSHRMGFGAAPGGHWLGYFVAGRDDRLEAGKRRFNWAWYRRADEDELRDHLTDAEGTHYPNGIPHDRIRPELRARMRESAASLLAPQIQAVIEATEAPFLQPIYDFASERLVAGRIALVGDAAATARPHVGMGVSKAAEDAVTLADALDATDRGDPHALDQWERRRLAFGRALVAWSRDLGAPIGPESDDPARRATAARYRRPEVLLTETAASDPSPYLQFK